MKNTIVLFLFLLSASFSQAQYALKKEVDGVQVFTKWGHEKWWKRKSPEVLIVKVVNNNDVAVRFDLGIEFFKDLVMVEDAKPANYCLSAHKSLMPRMAGLVFKPAKVTSSEIDSFELTELEIEKLARAGCAEPK